MEDPRLARCTLYFSFYLLEMMRKLNRYDDFRKILERWSAILEQGFTTFPERPGETRSDCHAWSAGPFYQLLKVRRPQS